MNPELRKDPVIDRWVIISTDRGKRPHDYPQPPRRVDPSKCPFCPGNEAATPPEVSAIRDPNTQKDMPGWEVRAISNKYPALRIEGDLNREGVGIFDKMNGVGAHEVIIETPQHDLSLSDLSIARISDVFGVSQGRMTDLERDPRFKYLMLFKNEGEAAGASLEHSHSQLIATPVVPKRVQEEIEGCKRYYAYKERCIFCDIVRQEMRDRERVVDENSDYLVLSPFAARFPYEIWILPKDHRASFHKMTREERNALADILRRALRRFRVTLNDPAYNMMLHTEPVGNSHEHHFHWHLELIPKLTRVAGFEWGTGFYINSTSPEQAAEHLREVRSEQLEAVTPMSTVQQRMRESA
ncbi:MAG: galactose-1-phosphate uridylyltransferase [candidate division Zixibacteria bacterium]|nr:galactose-1-phosphate uridylyltransferase [candidate division Zixibacteria bacterium]